ncbi:MAG: low molecular weight phosphatase family protein [Thiohalomonadaceae bacterium]
MANPISRFRPPVYGGRRARARTYFFQLQGLLGRLGRFSQIDFSRVDRLVFLCKGNICRSPYAEARARQLGLPAVSCGLECPNGDLANNQAMRNARERGLDLRLHRTTRASDLSISSSDLIVAMEPLHARMIAPTASQTGAQLTLAGVWSQPERPYIHDPFGLDDASFQACFTLIDRSVAALRDRLLQARGAASHQTRSSTRTG